MTFNSTKFQLVRFGKDQEIKNNTILFSDEMKEVISPKETVRDLGIMIDSNASFNTQRKLAVIKAKQNTGWVLRTFRDRSPKLMTSLWKSLIHPHLDYCS